MTDFTDEELALDPHFADRFERDDRRPPCQLYLISPPAIDDAFVARLAEAFDGGSVAAFQLRDRLGETSVRIPRERWRRELNDLVFAASGSADVDRVRFVRLP